MSTITLSIGDTGIKLGHAYWKLLCLEHNIEPDLTLSKSSNKTSSSNVIHPPNSFFLETIESKYKPRSILIDIDNRQTSLIKKGDFSNLHSFAKHPTDSSEYNTWSSCYLGVSQSNTLNYENEFRREVEKCPSLRGFHMIYSLSHHSSGIASGLLEYLYDTYNSSLIETFNPGPNLQDGNNVDTYHTLLSLANLHQYAVASLILPFTPQEPLSLQYRTFYLSTYSANHRFPSVPYVISPVSSLQKRSSHHKFLIPNRLELPVPNVPLRIPKSFNNTSIAVLRSNIWKTKERDWFLQYPVSNSPLLKDLHYCITFSFNGVSDFFKEYFNNYIALKGAFSVNFTKSIKTRLDSCKKLFPEIIQSYDKLYQIDLNKDQNLLPSSSKTSFSSTSKGFSNPSTPMNSLSPESLIKSAPATQFTSSTPITPSLNEFSEL